MGKTNLVRVLASYTGNELREVAVTSDTDTTDLLGCFEQVDVQRKRRSFVVAFDALQEQLMRALLTWQGGDPNALAFMTELRCPSCLQYVCLLSLYALSRCQAGLVVSMQQDLC